MTSARARHLGVREPEEGVRAHQIATYGKVSMKAFMIHGYGQPIRSVDVSEPVIGDADVLVDMRAASVNQLDIKIAAGEFRSLLRYRMPLALGHDLAGVVTAVGTEVTRFAVGDAVYGRVRDGRIGTFAERVAVAEDDLALLPHSVDLRDAASLPLVALTAWQALVELGNVGKGDKVLVHAGAGGVGSIAIQLAKHLGATVATTVGETHAQLARDLGADIVIDYRSQRFEEVIGDYDFVLDSVGEGNVRRSLRVLRLGGRVVGIAGPPTPAFARSVGAGLVVRTLLRALSSRVRREARRRKAEYDFLWMHPSGDQLAEIARLVNDGAIRPLVDEAFPFHETAAALTALSRNGRAGKVVIYRK